MGTELSRVTAREALAVDLDKSCRAELPSWAVSHESLVPVTDGLLIIVGVCLEKLQVCRGQLYLPTPVTHGEVGSQISEI